MRPCMHTQTMDRNFPVRYACGHHKGEMRAEVRAYLDAYLYVLLSVVSTCILGSYTLSLYGSILTASTVSAHVLVLTFSFLYRLIFFFSLKMETREWW